MGPIALFDKSFLQSLSLDESVWFDHFFIANVCPLFYVETLADLEKSVRKGRTPEQEVGVIADKFPEMHGTPSAFHLELCIANMLGQRVPMTGQIPVAGGHFVKVDGKTGAVFNKIPEAEAFARWQERKFEEVERLYARIWRMEVSALDLNEVAAGFKALGIDGKSCRTLEQAKSIASGLVWDQNNPFKIIRLAEAFLHIPPYLHSEMLKRWNIANYPPLEKYAPYAAHVLKVEVFFQIALAANLMSADRASNRTDIAYLFYLPFCMVFVSSDNLHRRCAPLFMRKDQEFLWGPDLKEGLKRANTYYLRLPHDQKEKGVMSFAGAPPESNEVLSRIWDRHCPSWRQKSEHRGQATPYRDEALAKEFKKYKEASPLTPGEIDFDPEYTDSLSIERNVRRRKGSWWQVPKDLKDDGE